MVSLKKLCSKQNKMDFKVTFESTSKRSQVHNVKSTECACILTSLAVSGASALIPLLLLWGSEGRITPSSKSLFHLYPITPSSGGGEAAQADRTGFLYIILLPPSFLFSFAFALHISRGLLALFGLKTLFDLGFCCFLSTFGLQFTFTSPSFPLPVAFFTLFHVVNIYINRLLAFFFFKYVLLFLLWDSATATLPAAPVSPSFQSETCHVLYFASRH